MHANGSVTFNISVQSYQSRHEVLSDVVLSGVNKTELAVRQQKILARLDKIHSTANVIEAKFHAAPSKALQTSPCEVPPRSTKLDRVPSHEDAVAAAVTLAKELLKSPLSLARTKAAHSTGTATPRSEMSPRESCAKVSSSGPIYYAQGPAGFIESSTSINSVAKDNEWVVVSPAKEQHLKTSARSVVTGYQNSTADSVAAAVVLAQKVLSSNSVSSLPSDLSVPDELVGVFTQSPRGFTRSPIKTSDDWVLI